MTTRSLAALSAPMATPSVMAHPAPLSWRMRRHRRFSNFCGTLTPLCRFISPTHRSRGLDQRAPTGMRNRAIQLPDFRGYALSALDDMGNSASGRLSLMGASATTLGGVGGSQNGVLAAIAIFLHIAIMVAHANTELRTPRMLMGLLRSGRLVRAWASKRAVLRIARLIMPPV